MLRHSCKQKNPPALDFDGSSPWKEEDIISLLGSDDKRSNDGKRRNRGRGENEMMGRGLALYSLIRRWSGRKSTLSFFSDKLLVLLLFGGGAAAVHWFLHPMSTSSFSSVVAPSSSFKVAVANYSSFPDDDEKSLKRIAWLMSFPNSGTSFTSYLIRTVTQTNTGSNYGHESGTVPSHKSGSSPSVPIFDDNPIPSWTESWNEILHQPSKGYILTKTHCGGFSFCPKCESFVYNSQLFLKKCLEGDFVMKPEVVSKGYASKDKIARAIHLIRDPFDNVVARFHLERQTLEVENKYSNSREGFLQFCDELGKIDLIEKAQKQAHVFVEDVADLAIPCKADFYRYIQWHNMAFTTTWNLGIPTLVVYYESYGTSFNETKDALLEFLEQDEVADAPPFATGKTYRDYFTADEIDAVSKLTERLALRESWLHTKHYFGQ